MNPDKRDPDSEVRNPAATPRESRGGVSMETCRTCSCCRRTAEIAPGRSRHGLSWISGPVSRTIWTLVLLLALHLDHCLATLEPPSFPPSAMRSFKDGNDNKYFRFTTLDAASHHLYVGAMEYVYRLDIDNFTDPSSPIRHLRSSELSEGSISQVEANKRSCLQREHSDVECRNHIRAIIPKGDEVYLCGTGAFSPIEFSLHYNTLVLTSDRTQSGDAICPFSPDQQNTILYVESGNPEGATATYSGTYMQSGPIIYRSRISSRHMRSADQDSKWLNEPTFVKSFDVGNYVYFFFRESALEYMNCGKAIYSRVARVCKNDQGTSSSVLRNHWTTYLKVRLNCSQPGEYPFYYNELRDIVRDGSTFHGVFTTNENGLHGSAVCSFSMQAIEEAFNGPFKEQKDSIHQWLKVPEERIPEPRPGTCDLNSMNQADNVMQFIKARPLMDLAVEATGGQPLFDRPDTVFTHLAVDHVGDGYSVLFLVTDAGQIQKVVQWRDADEQIQSRVLATWTPFGDSLRIWKLDFYSGDRGKFLFLSSDERVTQLELSQCSGYSVCTECVHDPYCGWNPSPGQGQCVRYSSGDNSLIQDVKNSDSVSVCNSACKNPDVTHEIRVKGDAAHLTCASQCETAAAVTWFHDDQSLQAAEGKHFVTRDNGLVILNIGDGDRGVYECRAGDVILARHQINLTDCGDAEECWREEFRKWCAEFETYKAELNHWRCLKRGCTNVTYADHCGISESIMAECPAPGV